MIKLIFLSSLFSLLLVNATVASAQNSAGDTHSIFDFKIQDPTVHRSSVYWFPLLGLVVPGMPQLLNDQEGAGAVYASAAGLGLGVTLVSLMQINSSISNGDDYTTLNGPEKAMTWGLQVYQTAGSLSTYHAFRSTVEQRRAQGDFGFLVSDEETTQHLLTAPFQVQRLIEPAVFVPLGIILGGVILAHNTPGAGSQNMTFADGLFTAGISYNAGVGEESLFRGYLMMNLRRSWDSDFWSLAATATVFAAAHLSAENPLPWPQFVLGSYLGWLTQHDHWTLSRAIFVHTWWDLIAVASEFSTDVTNHAVFMPLANLAF